MDFAKLVLDKVRSFPSSEAAAEFFGNEPTDIQDWLEGKPIPIGALALVFDPTKFAIPQVGQTSPQDRKITLLLPAYKSTNPVSAFSILSLIDKARMAVMLDFGDAFIAHSRNKLACGFLKSKSDWALTLDDDMVLPCGNADWFNSFTDFGLPKEFAGLNTVDRLLSHKKTLVGALYFGRWKHGKPVFAEGSVNAAEEQLARSGPHDMCKPTKWVGTGCMLIHRSVFLDIEKKFPHLARNANGDFGNWFTSSEHDMQQAVKESLDILADTGSTETARVIQVKKLLEESRQRSKVHSSLGMGEDVQFCVRATQAGHQPHVDLGLICGHMGSFVYGPQRAGWKT